MNKNILAALALSLFVVSCGNLRKQTTDESASMQPVGPVFCADSAYLYCQAQCDFGPRTMNSKAHDDCEKWIISKFESFGMQVTPQKAVLKGYDGTSLNSTNIIASYRPELSDRILVLCGGKVSGIVDGRTADKNEVGLLMTRVGGGVDG